jgi:hypothetical protein
MKASKYRQVFRQILALHALSIRNSQALMETVAMTLKRRPIVTRIITNIQS